jgi:hypothetical protein
MALAYYISDERTEGAEQIETPEGNKYIRVVMCPDGEGLDWAMDNTRKDEELLNTMESK